MRVRLGSEVANAIHRLALSENRSEQNMLDRVIAVGLRSLGATTPTAPLPELLRDRSARVTIPIPALVHSLIKRMAMEHDRSARSMAGQVLLAGLRAMNAWPPHAQGNAGPVGRDAHGEAGAPQAAA